MPTKTAARKRPVRTAARSPRVVSVPAADVLHKSKPLGEKKCATVHVFPNKVEFFEQGNPAPYSRIPYGPQGSNARAAADVAIGVLRDLEPATVVRTFDASGREIS